MSEEQRNFIRQRLADADPEGAFGGRGEAAIGGKGKNPVISD